MSTLLKRTPLITAICCTEDRPEWLPRAVELFLAQDWPRKELLILDRSSTDLRARLPADDRVRVWWFEKQAVAAMRHRTGIQAARGEFVTYWDDDDWHAQTRLSEQIKPLISGAATMTGIPLSVMPTITLPSLDFWKLRIVPGPPKPADPIHGMQPDKPGLRFADATAMFPKCLVRGDQDPALELAKIPFLQEMAGRGGKQLRMEDERLYCYVRHGGNVWSMGERWAFDPRPRPPWIPEEQFDFWRQLRVKGATAVRTTHSSAAPSRPA
jgi:glycosyltransferase involved in cell wall biosynthesis